MSLCPHLCLLAFRALFENKRAPKRGRNANFQKSLKTPRNGVIKTLCAKNQVCKSIGVTCSTYRRFTKNKVENDRKRALKGPKIKISKNKKHPLDCFPIFKSRIRFRNEAKYSDSLYIFLFLSLSHTHNHTQSLSLIHAGIHTHTYTHAHTNTI